MFIKITCSNGFFNCDEETYVEVADAKEANEEVETCLEQYSFADPDDRFCDMDDEEDIENYYENICADWEEVSEEEYLENIDRTT